MHSKIISIPCLAVLLACSLAPVYSREQGDVARIQPAALHPPASPEDKKKPLTREDANSGALQKIRQITGVGLVGIGRLYETSGAKDFKEFSLAFFVAQNLHVDPQIVLRALWGQSLEEIIQDFGYPEDQAKRALRIANDQREEANKAWKEGRPIQ